MENISEREKRQEKEVNSGRVQAKTERKGGKEEIERMDGKGNRQRERKRVGNGSREGCRSHLLSGN